MKCRRKVEERVVSGGTTVYYCPNCSNSYRRFEIGVYIRLFMRDFSGGRWVTVFNAQVEELYLTTPLGLKHLFESSDTNKFRVFINKITFKPFTWLLKAERDLYNGLWKTRFIVSSFNNTIDLLSTGAGLLQEISELESGHWTTDQLSWFNRPSNLYYWNLRIFQFCTSALVCIASYILNHFQFLFIIKFLLFSLLYRLYCKYYLTYLQSVFIDNKSCGYQNETEFQLIQFIV